MEYSRIDIYNRNLESRKRSVATWQVPESVKKSVLRFLEELELGRVNKGVKVSEARQSKYLDVLRIPLQFWNKPDQRVTLKDVETFEKALSSGELQSNRGREYAKATKVDIRRALTIYLKWRLGNETAARLTDWLDTRGVRKTPEYLKEADVLKLLKNCRCARERFLVAVLFDSGARAGEFLNIRWEDIELPTGDSSYVKLTLKEEYSKTKGRVISLYWQHSLEAVRDYLEERDGDHPFPQDPVFGGTYDAARFFLMRLGKKVLGRSVHFHLFRHSSATYYATKLNRQELCYRYGWAFSSDMPDVYISRSGMQSAQMDKRFEATELDALKRQLERQEEERKLNTERMDNLIRRLLADRAALAALTKEKLGLTGEDELSIALRAYLGVQG